jgi:hypothetical protein
MQRKQRISKGKTKIKNQRLKKIVPFFSLWFFIFSSRRADVEKEILKISIESDGVHHEPHYNQRDPTEDRQGIRS